MSECEHLKSCPFFNDNMPDMPDHADLFKGLYCRGNNSMCARYMVYKALGKGSVPANLYPHHTERAKEIIRNAGKQPME